MISEVEVNEVIFFTRFSKVINFDMLPNLPKYLNHTRVTVGQSTNLLIYTELFSIKYGSDFRVYTYVLDTSNCIYKTFLTR